VAKVIADQKAKYQRFLHGLNDPNDVPFIILIFDDIISDLDLRYAQLMNELVFQGRLVGF
jgi:hypothetical protein